jgi:hypothetical protein
VGVLNTFLLIEILSWVKNAREKKADMISDFNSRTGIPGDAGGGLPVVEKGVLTNTVTLLNILS